MMMMNMNDENDDEYMNDENDEHELHMINDAEGGEAYAIFSSSPS